MKVSLFVVTILAVLVGGFALLGATGAQAQQNVCQANPSPVDSTDPSIIVSAPVSGATVTSPIHVTGQARVFEAVVSLTLYGAGGTELVSTTTNAAEGQTLSPFSADVAYPVTAATPVCLWVFESSARDGEPINVVQVPLNLNTATLPPTGSGGQPASGLLLASLMSALAVAGAGLAGAGWLARRRSV